MYGHTYTSVDDDRIAVPAASTCFFFQAVTSTFSSTKIQTPGLKMVNSPFWVSPTNSHCAIIWRRSSRASFRQRNTLKRDRDVSTSSLAR